MRTPTKIDAPDRICATVERCAWSLHPCAAEAAGGQSNTSRTSRRNFVSESAGPEDRSRTRDSLVALYFLSVCSSYEHSRKRTADRVLV